MLSPIFMATVKAQNNGDLVGNWPLNEIKTVDNSTTDTTGVNNGIVAGHPDLPTIVDGKFGKALKFSGDNFVYVPIKFVVGFPPTPQTVYMPISPNLDVQKYVQAEAWINVSGFKNVTYNNIVVKCNHPDQACAWQNTTRVLGLSLRAGPSKDGVVEGALSGYILTDNGEANEIVTKNPLPINQWVNVEFTRTPTGMHLIAPI